MKKSFQFIRHCIVFLKLAVGKRSRLIAAGAMLGLVFSGVRVYQIKNSGVMTGGDLAVIVFFILLLFLAVNWRQKIKLEAELKKARLEREQLYYEAYDDLVNLIRERQHDLKNHISAILGMVYTVDNYDDLVRMQKEYCQEIVDRNKETKILLSVGSPLLTGFLHKKIQEAESHGISVDFKIDMEETKPWALEYEMVDMLGILLDNAIEVLEKEAPCCRKIYFFLSGREIIVANSSKAFDAWEMERFFGRGFSSKGKGRGVGLAKLKKIVTGAGGRIIVSNEEYDKVNFLQFRITFKAAGEEIFP